MREERISFKSGSGETLSGVLHHPGNSAARGAVILCHGMESDKSSEKLVTLGRALAQRGLLALRFDFSCAGESSGNFADITYSGEVADLSAAYALVQTAGPLRTALLGSSMGGTVALLFASREPEVAALVTIAAPLHPEVFPKRVLTARQLDDWRGQGFVLYNGRRLNLGLLHDLERLDVAAAARRITCPALIIHGDADVVVPVEEAYELHDCLAGIKKLCILKGADHRLSDPQILRLALTDAVDWLDRHVTDPTP